MNQSAYTPKRIEGRDIYHRPGQDSLSAEKEKGRLGEKDSSAGSKSKTHFFTNLTSVNIATAFARARITADTINNRPPHLKGAPMSPSQLPRMNHQAIPDAHDPRAHFESRPYGSNYNSNNDGARPIRDIANRAQTNPYGSHNYGYTAQPGYQGMDIDSGPGYENRDTGSAMPDGFLRERDWKTLQSGVPSWLKKAQDKRPNDLMQVSPPRGIMDTPSNALGRSAMGGAASAPSFDPLMDNLIDMKSSHQPRDTAAAVAAARRFADEALADNDYLAGTTTSRGNYRNINNNDSTLRRGIGGHPSTNADENGPYSRNEPARTNVGGGVAASNFPATRNFPASSNFPATSNFPASSNFPATSNFPAASSGMPPRTGNTLSRNPSARSAATAAGRGGGTTGRGGATAVRGGAAGRGGAAVRGGAPGRGGTASRGGGAAAFIRQMRQQQQQQQQQDQQEQQQEQNEQEQRLDHQHSRGMLNGTYANSNEYSSAQPDVANGAYQLRSNSRFSVRSRVSTPARSSYTQDFGLDEDGGEDARYLHKTPTGAAHANGSSVPTPYTARIKGPGAFPATAQRYSQRRPRGRNLASDVEDDVEGDMISPSLTRKPRARQASNATSLGKGSLLVNHRYLSHGNASNRGWDAYTNPDDVGEHGTVHSFSDSFASNSSAGRHDGDVGRDNPTLLKRLLRNIAAGWAGSAGSFAERVSFVFFMIYFLVKETFLVVGAFVFRMLVSLIIGPVYSGVRETVLLPISLWRMLSPGSSRDTTRSMTGVLTGFMVVAFSVVVSQYGTSTLSGLSAVPGHFLGGMWSSSSSSSMRPPLSITPPAGLEPLTDEEINRLGGQGSAAVERLVNVEQTLRHLYGLLDTLRSYRDEETQEVRESLKRMQQEKQVLLDANRGEKQRVDSLEREYLNIKRDIKAQVAKGTDASKHAKEIEGLKRRVDQLMRGGAGKGSGPGLEEVRKLVNDAIGKQERELKDMLKPGWLTTDGDAAYANVARMIEDALSRYANDRLGKTDFALSSAGARIIPGLTSPTFEPPVRGFSQRIWRKLGMVSSQPPAAILDPNTHVGECWPMLGSSGQVAIHLSQPVDVSDFAIEHVAKSVAIDWRSAPRQIEVWGYVLDNGNANSSASSQPTDPNSAERDAGVAATFDSPLASASISADPAVTLSADHPASQSSISIPLYSESSSYGKGKLERLAWYEYEPSDSSSLQIFRPASDRASGSGAVRVRVQTLVLKVKSNWGHPGHTCLYRFRVHGHRAASPAEAAAP